LSSLIINIRRSVYGNNSKDTCFLACFVDYRSSYDCCARVAANYLGGWKASRVYNMDSRGPIKTKITGDDKDQIKKPDKFK
jgi:hypothetical protein